MSGQLAERDAKLTASRAELSALTEQNAALKHQLSQLEGQLADKAKALQSSGQLAGDLEHAATTAEQLTQVHLCGWPAGGTV